MRVFRSALFLMVLVVPACGGKMNRIAVSGNPGAAEVSIENAVSWSRDVWPILTVRCQNCHTVGSGAEEVPDMRMTDPSATYLAWVNIFSTCNPNLFRVFPNNSELSFVYNKVSRPAPLCGQRMPLLGAPLEEAEQQTIKDWIDQGARHN